MPKRTIEIPEELAEFGNAVERIVRQMQAFERGAQGGRTVDFAAFERAIEGEADKAKLDVMRRALQCLDIDAERVVIGGKAYAKVGRYEAAYFAKAGAVTVTRSLYRECGQRNAKTVDAVSLRSGALDGWLPEAAKAIAFLLQQGTSREAEATARTLGVLPYSRCSFERVGHAVGALYCKARIDVEDALIKEFEVPPEARSVSASLDRVSLPMEEPRPRKAGRQKKDGPRRFIARNFRMAFCGTITFHDGRGNALHTIRYGRMPNADVNELVDAMAADVAQVRAKRPDLRVSLLADGAPALWEALDAQLNPEQLGVLVHRLIDYWHLVEKLAKAATVIHGENAKGVLQGWKMRLLNSSIAASAILAELQASGRQKARVNGTRPVHEAITYILNNCDRMDYAAARRAGLPLGSGNVEATCKSLVEVRMKRSGARWHNETGDHVLQLRALALSDRWDRAITLALQPLRTAVRAA